MASIFNENERKVRKLKKIALKVEALEESFKALTDDELRCKTDEFKARLEKGESLDDILVEAFATVREAASRVLGMRPYFVQIMMSFVLLMILMKLQQYNIRYYTAVRSIIVIESLAHFAYLLQSSRCSCRSSDLIFAR